MQGAVAHAVVGADGAVEAPRGDAEDVGGRAADVHREYVLAQMLRRGPHLQPDGRRGGQHRGSRPAQQVGVARGARHDVLHEQLVDDLTGGADRLARQGGAHVAGHAHLDPWPQRGRHGGPGRAITRVDHRRRATRRGHPLSHLGDARQRSALGAASQQNHVGPQAAQPRDALVGRETVVQAEAATDDGAGGQGRPFGA